MTGIPTVNNRLLFLYELLAFGCIAGFAAYDLRKKRVPDQALLLFLPFALVAPLIHAWPFWSGSLLLCLFLYSLAGAAVGFLVLLAAAMLSKEGAGIGGGDIKLAGVMGFIYGPSRMLAVLLIASGLAACVSLAVRHRRKKGMPSLPFVPFLMIGSLAVTLTAIL